MGKVFYHSPEQKDQGAIPGADSGFIRATIRRDKEGPPEILGAGDRAIRALPTW